VPVVRTSLYEMLAALKANGIRAVVTLRNVDDQGQPTWAARLNPPRTTEDWNEWWEHVFATVYLGWTGSGLPVLVCLLTARG
jgi:hypothetical protein